MRSLFILSTFSKHLNLAVSLYIFSISVTSFPLLISDVRVLAFV